MKTKIVILILCLWLLPVFALAVDSAKGLQESKENWQMKESFIKGGGKIIFAGPEMFPTPIFMGMTKLSTNFRLDTEKEAYQSGEKVQMTITAENNGFFKNNGNSSAKGPHVFYWWSAGNFLVGVYRLSEEVKDGEFLVASGRAFDKDSLSLYENEQKKFDFSWQIPENAINGTYEIRVYPSSVGILFMGTPEAYRSVLKTRIKIMGAGGKEEPARWDLGNLKLEGEPVRLKEKVVFLENEKDYNLNIPLKNTSEERKEIVVSKQIRRLSPQIGEILSEENEQIILEPKEAKTINYRLNKNNFQNEAVVLAQFAFNEKTSDKEAYPSRKSYFDFPISGTNQENVVVPLYIKGNADLLWSGIGIKIINKPEGTSILPITTINYFSEIYRSDPLFQWSGEKKRTQETNLDLSLKLFDKEGNKIDEIGYHGPSWDRSAELYKIINLSKKYDYFKLVGEMADPKSKKIQVKEIEYWVPPKSFKMSLFDKAVGMIKNNWKNIVLGLGGVIGLSGLAIGLITRKIKTKN